MNHLAAVITHPETGEVFDPLAADTDTLLTWFADLQQLETQTRVARRVIAERIAALTEGTAKTRRVRGNRMRAKVTMPPDTWDGSTLKQLWTDYPEYRRYLRIARVEPNMREVKKMQNETGPERFRVFKADLNGANRGAIRAPSITIEEAGD